MRGGGFETNTFGFDSGGDPIDLQCEGDGADYLDCRLVNPDTVGRSVRFRRRASLESTRQPLLCDKLFERFLISGGIF